MNDETPPNPLPLPPPVPFAPVVTKGRWRLLLVLPLLGLALAVAGFGAVFGPGPMGEAATIVVPHGAGPHDVAALLDAKGAIYNSFLFRVAAKFLAANALKAGEYPIAAGQSLADIVAMIHEGRSITRLFTVSEGLTSGEVAQALNEEPTLGGEPVPVPAEGSLLPESYRYIYGDSRAGMVARMQKARQETLADLWAKRDVTLPITTPEQAMVMASVVEKETGKSAERPRIAGVFYNRLRQHMRLQSDPTVIYGILKAKGGMDRVLAHADLSFASPYNTYLNDGLPPQPICNPGKAALESALHPEPHDYLYFVADGTGGHAFAKTLAEHNRNVTRWNQVKLNGP